MAGYTDRMKDYVPVNERISAFTDAHPDGSLQSEIVELTESRVTVKAYAYRTPDDPRPGTGHSSLAIPGSTPYTRGSEIENAETSAWGRAIAALGFEVKRGIASAEEVANKSGQAESARSTRAVAAAAPAPARQRLAEAMARHNVSVAALERLSDSIGLVKGERASDEEIERLIDLIEHSHAPELAGLTPEQTPLARRTTDPIGPEDVEPQPIPLPGLTEEEFEQVQAAVVPPKPGTDEYKRLPAFARSEARAYWAAEPEAVEA